MLLDYPLRTGGTKVRPALVVQSDKRNRKLSQTIAVMITGNVHRVSADATQLLIQLSTTEGKRSGLQRDSAITCGNLFTLPTETIQTKIGTLSASVMQQVDDCLKAALGIL